MLRYQGRIIATIEVTDCGRTYARLGITADRSIAIDREELLPTTTEEDDRG